MKFNQLAVGKSYCGPKKAIRTIVLITAKNEVYYMDDSHLISDIAGQEFATWAKSFADSTPSHHREYLAKKRRM